MLDHSPARASLVVFVPTFRRPSRLLETLDSLSQQDISSPFRIVVADNDARDTEGALVARRWAGEIGWDNRLSVITVEERGLSACRNAGLAEAFKRSEVSAVAMIDDDTVADKNWLASIVKALHTYSPNVLGGPTIYHFATTVPETISRAEMFGLPCRRSGLVPSLRSSNNCVITRPTWMQLGPELFDHAYSRSGGEDADFFARCKREGLTFAWATEAIVRELVPLERCNEDWVLRRHRLTAANAARIDVRRSGFLKAVPRQSLLITKEIVGGAIKSFSRNDTLRFKGRMRFCGVQGRIAGLLGKTDDFY